MIFGAVAFCGGSFCISKYFRGVRAFLEMILRRSEYFRGVAEHLKYFCGVRRVEVLYEYMQNRRGVHRNHSSGRLRSGEEDRRVSAIRAHRTELP
jgi:hypothetical protein